MSSTKIVLEAGLGRAFIAIGGLECILPHDEYSEACLSEIRTEVSTFAAMALQALGTAERREQAAVKELTAYKAADVHSLSDVSVRVEVWKLTGGACCYCEKPLAHPVDGGAGDTMVVEHVVPKSQGGPDNLVNYVPACASCNSIKQDRHVLHLIRHLQRRSAEIVTLTGVTKRMTGEHQE